jgi:hypothetical protein
MVFEYTATYAISAYPPIVVSSIPSQGDATLCDKDYSWFEEGLCFWSAFFYGYFQFSSTNKTDFYDNWNLNNFDFL